MIQRTLEEIVRSRLFSGKTILLLGPRQVGKTTLARRLANSFAEQHLWLSGDDPATVQVLSNASLARLQAQIGAKILVVIDEAQRIPGIGITLKLLHDNLPQVQVLVTGSSALDLNEQNEIRKSRKIYFFDNGVRNAVIGNFSPIESRTDTGPLWENYLVSERRKQIEYARTFTRAYFWRTVNQQEIDYVEELDGRFRAFEFKWSAQGKVRFPAVFLEKYEVTETRVLTPENYDEWLEE